MLLGTNPHTCERLILNHIVLPPKSDFNTAQKPFTIFDSRYGEG